MYRFLLRPRWVAIMLLAAVVAVVFGLLGRWQYHSARQLATGVELPTATNSQPLATVAPAGLALPAEAVGSAVTITGTFDPASQRIFPGQALDGRTGSWVLTLLRPADGSPAVLVARGWLPAGAAAPAPPAGPVRVLGWLGAAQDPGAAAAAPSMPAGELYRVSPAVIANQVRYPVRDGFIGETSVGATSIRATSVAAGGGRQASGDLTPIARPAGGVTWDWQNLGYAVQWGCFAIAVFVALGFGARREARALAAGRAGTLGRREVSL